MKYGKNDLRAVDVFSLTLVGAGLLFLVMGVKPMHVNSLLLGVVFTSLGTALNLSLIKVIANKGEDVPDAYGEPSEVQ